MRYTLGTNRCQGVDIGAANHDCARPKGNRLQNVGATPHAAVEDDGNPAGHPLRDDGQGIDGGRQGVEVTRTVVRDRDGIGTGFDRLLGIGQTAMRSVEDGIRDLRKIRALGLRGVMLPGNPAVADYHDPVYAPFYEAAIDLELPGGSVTARWPSEALPELGAEVELEVIGPVLAFAPA